MKSVENFLAPAAALFGSLLLAFGLAWVSNGRLALAGWPAFFVGALLMVCLLWLAWHSLQRSERGSLPPWLAGLLIGAALLRLLAGGVWFVALPVLGHGNPAEVDGYVMADAHERDRVAWKLSQSDKPLWEAFGGTYRKADQYGGLLFLSSLVYRYLGEPFGGAHQPLLMVLLTATFSALAVPFLWAFCRRAWGNSVAAAAAWGMALYPEAILLGSSQMREAFIVTLTAAALYGLLRSNQERRWGSLAWVLGALLLSLPLSPVFAAFLMGMLALLALFMGRNYLLHMLRSHRWLWVVVVGLALAALMGAYLTLRRMAPEGMNNPLLVVSWWFRKSAEWQLHLTEKSSGWMQRYFKNLPDWMPMPMIVLYGVLQPFLPGALIATSAAPVWTWIAIWRALGWTLLLPFLLYAPLRAAWSPSALVAETGQPATRRDMPVPGPNRGLARGLALVVWLVILVVSFRSGGDQWDNTRYRAAFAAPQIALAAWALGSSIRRPDPWMQRVLITVGLVILWFIPWYLRRATTFEWPVVDVFKTLALGIACGVLYSVWDWARSSRQAAKT